MMMVSAVVRELEQLLAAPEGLVSPPFASLSPSPGVNNNDKHIHNNKQ